MSIGDKKNAAVKTLCFLRLGSNFLSVFEEYISIGSFLLTGKSNPFFTDFNLPSSKRSQFEQIWRQA